MNKLANYSKTVFISDIHAPFQDEIALSTLKDFIKWFKPDDIIFLGDAVDFYAVSHFVKDPERALKLQDEIDEAKYTLNDICKVKAKKWFIRGNHECFHKKTEVLCSDGWKPITHITLDDKVAQYRLDDKKIDYVKPKKLMKYHADYLYEIENNAMKQVVTSNHEVIYNNKKINADQLVDLQSDKFLYQLNTDKQPYDITDDYIRLLTWVVMDGTMVDNRKYKTNSNKRRIQFHISKQRKINSLCLLLDKMNINYTLRESKKTGVNKLTPYFIRIYGDHARYLFELLNDKKVLPDYFSELDKRQTKILLDTIIETDGSKHFSGYNWSSTSIYNVNIVSKLMVENGIIHTVKTIKNRSGFNNSKPQYLVRFWIENKPGLLKTSVKKVKYNDFVYCLSVPKENIITRIDGKVALTGNSRLQKYLWSEAKELSSLRSLQFENLMEFKKSGITYIKEGKMNYKGLIVKHGNLVRKFASYSAKAEYEKSGMSGVSGHTHRLGTYRHNNEGGAFIWVESGCLCKLDPEYLEGDVANWQSGFSIGYFKNNSKRYHLETVPIIHSKAQYGGMEFI